MSVSRSGGFPHPADLPQAPLFVDDLDLLVDHPAGKPVDRDVHPIALLTINDKAVLKTGGIGRVAP